MLSAEAYFCQGMFLHALLICLCVCMYLQMWQVRLEGDLTWRKKVPTQTKEFDMVISNSLHRLINDAKACHITGAFRRESDNYAN